MDRISPDDSEFQEIAESYEETCKLYFEDDRQEKILDKSVLEGEEEEEQNRSRLRDLPVYLLSFFITLSGLTAMIQPLATRLSNHPGLFRMLNILDYYHWAKMISVVFGLFLILLSFNLLKRKKIAWQLAFFSSLAYSFIHLIRCGSEYVVWIKERELNEAIPLITGIAPVLTVILLYGLRKRFTVKSDRGDLANGIFVLVISFAGLALYGTMGFWLLEIRDFGINFDLVESFQRAVRQLLFMGNDDILPKSRFGHWFLKSINIFETMAFTFTAVSLFRPINYVLSVRPKEKENAAALLARYGKDALDPYKLLEDKSYYFSPSKKAFVAYSSVMNVAICLGDPVGAEAELKPLIKEFRDYCHGNDWKLAFLQVKPDYLELYKELGLQVLKVGEDAVVDLDDFTEKTVKGKNFKAVVKKLAKQGYKLNRYVPPHEESLLDSVEQISQEWLSLPGRRERGFSLGWFDREALKQETLYVLESDKDGAIAFVNQVRSYAKGQVTIDMMRHRTEVPNGAMDYLFALLLTDLHERGFKSFSLGLAALSGVGEKKDASKEERAVHLIYEHMNRFFSYKGLRRYKSKFHPQWEERFLIYEGGTANLIKTALAITRAGKID